MRRCGQPAVWTVPMPWWMVSLCLTSTVHGNLYTTAIWKSFAIIFLIVSQQYKYCASKKCCMYVTVQVRWNVWVWSPWRRRPTYLCHVSSYWPESLFLIGEISESSECTNFQQQDCSLVLASRQATRQATTNMYYIRAQRCIKCVLLLQCGWRARVYRTQQRILWLWYLQMLCTTGATERGTLYTSRLCSGTFL